MTRPPSPDRNPPHGRHTAGQGQMPTRHLNRYRASKSQRAARGRPSPQKWYTDHSTPWGESDLEYHTRRTTT